MTKVWNNNYKKLIDHYEKNGHFAILLSDRPNKRLRHWFQSQLCLFNKQKLNDKQAKLLIYSDVDFSLQGIKWENWERHYRILNLYHEKNGHSSVSQLVKGIGPWLSAQRVLYRRSELSLTKITLLEKLNIVWNPSDNFNEKWQSQYEKVRSYYLQHGHSNMPRREFPDPGIWISAQRTAYRKGLLSKKRITALDKIDFKWSLK